MTIQEALAFGRRQLTHSSSPVLDARLLLEFTLGKNHTYLVAHREEALTAVQETAYRQLLQRASQQEPIPYLTGEAHFYGRPFHVTPAVLIPRPETEQLVACALTWAKTRHSLHIVDVGAGSGCIAVTLALALPDAKIEAVDLSEPALAIARQNAERHAVASNIQFHRGNLLEPIAGRPNLVVANLPYIADVEWPSLSDGVKLFEPVSALKGGPSGLDIIQQLLEQAKTKLSSGGAMFLEIGWKQGSAVFKLARTHFPAAQVELLADYAGNDRVISIT